MPLAAGMGDRSDPRELLGIRGWCAAREVVRRVRSEVTARLELAALFGSRARGQARPDSDVDVLLVFDWLPPDREPQATEAERIADAVAAESGVPLTAWSISLADLRCGCRTPMLVDAMEDAIPIWPARARVPRVPLTPADALFCATCLLERVAEGGEEVARMRARGAADRAALRARDDVVRLCTGLLLLRGRTRPRRADAIAGCCASIPSLGRDPVLQWAERSFRAPEPPPPWPAMARTVDRLRRRLRREVRMLAAGAGLATAQRYPRDPFLRIVP